MFIRSFSQKSIFGGFYGRGYYYDLFVSNFDLTKRKILEGVETVKENARGRTPLNTCNQMDQWQPTIYLYLEKNLMIMCVPSPCKSVGNARLEKYS